MKLISATTLIAVLSIASLGRAYAGDSANSPYSKAELHKLVSEAHTADQYRALAEYFRAQESRYQQLAHTEKTEWSLRAQNVTSNAAKYPRPVDSSRNRYEYFIYKAGQMNQQAMHYEHLAAGDQ